MARRYDHSKEELKEMIVQASLELLIEQGFEKLSMRKISAKIGYTVGTIYQFYPSQQALIIQMNTISLNKLNRFLKEQMTTQTPAEAAHTCVQGYFDFARDNQHLWECLTDYKIPPDADLPDDYQKAITDLFDFVSEPLTHYFDDKEQALMQSKIIWASVHGICQLGLMGKLNNIKQTDTQALLTQFLDSYLKGLSS